MIAKQTILADKLDTKISEDESPINKFRKIAEKSAIAMVLIVIMPIGYEAFTGTDPSMSVGLSFGQGESTAKFFKDGIWALQVVILLTFFGSVAMKIEKRGIKHD